jgi:hypothetical protein
VIETGGSVAGKAKTSAASARSTRDTVRAGSGSDRIDARDGDGDDRIGCGSGRDTVNADAGDKVDRSCERVRYERRTPKRGKKRRRR